MNTTYQFVNLALCKELKDRRHFFLTAHHNFIFLLSSVAVLDGVKLYASLQ